MAMNGNEGGSAYPPNPDVKSGSCLIVGFQPLTVFCPSYWNAYKTESGAAFSIDMVRLKLSFINGKGVAARVFDELDEIAKLEDPRSRGKALTGNLAGVWRYRVGDYRILCDINDGRLVILVVDVAHRREVYKRR